MSTVKNAAPSLSSQDSIHLKLILVSGRTQEFLFEPSTSAHNVTQYVFDNWPADWEEERVEAANLLKLIYHGRFLHGSVTLSALGLPPGKVSVMHLVTRENLPEPNSNGEPRVLLPADSPFSDNLKKSKRGSCCRCCLS
uniref:Ubiquitin-like domain-containing protein n=1 Tax=Steinernema glaseri TaxID=37863 RepID=A0A1I7ZUI3_9BILA